MQNIFHDLLISKKNEVQQNWTEQENFDMYFYLFFNCFCQGVVSGRETGRWTMSPASFEFFLIFPNFLRS